MSRHREHFNDREGARIELLETERRRRRKAFAFVNPGHQAALLDCPRIGDLPGGLPGRQQRSIRREDVEKPAAVLREDTRHIAIEGVLSQGSEECSPVLRERLNSFLVLQLQILKPDLY
jgi:hypothetical protein